MQTTPRIRTRTPLAHERSIPFIFHLLIALGLSQKEVAPLVFPFVPNSMAAFIADWQIPRSDIRFFACLLRIARPLLSLRPRRRDESLLKIFFRLTVRIPSLAESPFFADLVLSLLFFITLFKWRPKSRFSKSPSALPVRICKRIDFPRNLLGHRINPT